MFLFKLFNKTKNNQTLASNLAGDSTSGLWRSSKWSGYPFGNHWK